jgi:EAL domain-containing protein (putative c-di-GMP-specific phosphodiesterase class I)
MRLRGQRRGSATGTINENPGDRKVAGKLSAFFVGHSRHFAGPPRHGLQALARKAELVEEADRRIKSADRHNEMVACLFLSAEIVEWPGDGDGRLVERSHAAIVNSRLQQCLRANDSFHQTGREEWQILLDGVREPRQAAVVAGKIVEGLSGPTELASGTMVLTPRIGISCYPVDAVSGADLIANARAAMLYSSKEDTAPFRFFSAELAERLNREAELRQMLRGALERDELELDFQPRIDLKTGVVRGLEALVRWDAPEHGTIRAARLIPIAEQGGLVEAVDDWVLRHACRQVVDWQAQGFRPPVVSVNIAPATFRTAGFVTSVERILGESGLPPEWLTLELPEHAVASNPDSAASILNRLELLGVNLAIDDFGSAFSSSALLRKCHLQYLKIDRRFVAGVPDNADAISITTAIIAMARRLNLKVIAEGVETEAQGVFLRANGCDEGQGYLFGRPVSAEQTAATLLSPGP